jgi:hypothetical protein
LATRVAAGDVGATVTVTRTTSLPNLHVTDAETGSGGAWALGGLDAGQTTVTATTVSGHYTNGLLLYGSSGDASYSESDTLTTTGDGAAGGLGGSLTDTYSANATADGTTYKPYPFGLDPSGSAGYGGTEHLNAWFSRTDSVSGNADPNGSSATEVIDESGGLDYQAHLGLFDLGSGRVWGARWTTSARARTPTTSRTRPPVLPWPCSRSAARTVGRPANTCGSATTTGTTTPS